MSEPLMSSQELESANRVLEGGSPEAILRWAVDRFSSRLTMATAFGAEGCCLIHMLADIDPAIRIFNLETGYQFPETLELRERIKTRYGIEVEYVRPELTVEDYEQEHGALYMGDAGWEHPYDVVDGKVPGLMLNRPEQIWLSACWEASGALKAMREQIREERR